MRFLGGLLALLLSASAALAQGVPGQSWTNAVLNAPVTTSPGSTDVLAIIQGGVTKQVSYGNLLTGGGNISITQMKGTYGDFTSVPTFGGGCGTQPNVWCQPFVGGDPTGVGVGDIVGLAASYTNATANLLSPFWSQIWDNGAGTAHIGTAANLNVTEWGSAVSQIQTLSINNNMNSSNAGSFGVGIEAETLMLGKGNVFGLIIEYGGDAISGHAMNSFVNFKSVGPTSGLPCNVTTPCVNNAPTYGIVFGVGTPGSTAPYGNPIQTTGTLIAIAGSDQFVATNGIDLANNGPGGGGAAITGCALKSIGYCLDGSGNTSARYGVFSANFPSPSAGNGYIGGQSTNGLELGGNGSVNDIIAVNKSLTTIFNVPTGTVNIVANGSLALFSQTTIPAGGTTGSCLLFSSTANFGVCFGSGAPTLSAAKGSWYIRNDGTTTNNRAYINIDGSTTWTAVITNS